LPETTLAVKIIAHLLNVLNQSESSVQQPCSIIDLNIPNWASQRRQWQGTEKLHQVTRWRKKNLGRTQAQSGASSPLAFMN